MSRRKRTLAAGLLLVVTGFSLIAILTASGHRISEWTCWSIRPGMTEEQVSTVFGVPPGSYRNAPWDARQLRRYADREAEDLLEALKVHGVVPEKAARGQPTYRTWISDCCVVDVFFDGHGRVIGPYLTPLRDLPMYVRLRWWLGR
jgi:hypothetical protein